MIFRSLEPISEFEKLRNEIFEIVNRVGFEDNQVILQSLTDNEEWHTGVGALEELEEKDELKYAIINHSIEHTEIAKIIQKYQGFRARIMRMDSRRCYSVHKDPTARIHIPIETNDQCWMVWPYNNLCASMPTGNIYFVDTTKSHTFLNAGLDPRIHLMFCVSKFPKLSNI
jgi:hypothetical protein